MPEKYAQLCTALPADGVVMTPRLATVGAALEAGGGTGIRVADAEDGPPAVAAGRASGGMDPSTGGVTGGDEADAAPAGPAGAGVGAAVPIGLDAVEAVTASDAVVGGIGKSLPATASPEGRSNP